LFRDALCARRNPLTPTPLPTTEAAVPEPGEGRRCDVRHDRSRLAGWGLRRAGTGSSRLAGVGLERFPLVHDRGSSHGESRIIRKAYFEHPDYVPLLHRTYELWQDLERPPDGHCFIQRDFSSRGVRTGKRFVARDFRRPSMDWSCKTSRRKRLVGVFRV